MNHTLIVLLFSALILSSCSYVPATPTGDNDSLSPLKFGGIFQLSGPQAFYGNMVRYGMELAVEDINNAGGIDGRKVIAIYEDSAGDRAKATTAAQKLINVDAIDALFTITPGMAGAVAPIAQENKIPYIYIGSVNIFAANKTFVFKDYPSPVDLCEVLMKKAVQEGHSRIGLFGSNDEVTWLCKDGAERIAPLAAYDTYNPGDSDFRVQLAKIKDQSVTALMLYGLASDCPSAFKQVRELGIKVQLFLPVQSFTCGNDANTKSNEDLLFNAYGSDISLDESSQDPAFISFKRRLEERNWSIHIRGSALEYDIVNEMADAYRGCSDRSCAADHLRQLRRKGITGEVSYDGGQIVRREVMLTKFSDGKWIEAN